MAYTAPYGFVPLSDKVIFPQWLRCSEDKDGNPVAPPLHDVPFKDGLCGTLTLEITAETPIFAKGTERVRGTEIVQGTQPERLEEINLPFRLGDGRYAIPGTSLRGALRNIVEIITYSRFNRVNDHRYAIRDLRATEVYTARLAKVNAGWLVRQDDERNPAVIHVCDFAKIEYRRLEELATQQGVTNVGNDRGFKPGKKQNAADKYKSWGQASRDVRLPIKWEQLDRCLSRRGEVANSCEETDGTLVFTGQPMNWRSGDRFKKHHDFFFTQYNVEQSENVLQVSREAFDDFEFIHSNRGQQNGIDDSSNEEWKHWKSKFKEGNPVPVFFVTDDEPHKLKAFGLAMMFRLAYSHSVHDAIENVSPDHLFGARLDFAEGLFGTVRENKNKRQKDEDGDGGLALKGRVGISHAIVEAQPEPEPQVRVILGTPRASYYPNYVEQRPGTYAGGPKRHKENNNYLYQTWMNEDVAPRGWKRYRATNDVSVSRAATPTTVTTSFRPLPQGTRFTSHIDVHNLLPQELGALLWAIRLGDDVNARHTLGMARPLGFGRSRMSVTAHNIQNMDGENVELQACVTAFRDWMNTQENDWENSPQIRELLALAQPVSRTQAEYQTLSEFASAKNDGWVLPSAATGDSIGVRPDVKKSKAARMQAKAARMYARVRELIDSETEVIGVVKRVEGNRFLMAVEGISDQVILYYKHLKRIGVDRGSLQVGTPAIIKFKETDSGGKGIVATYVNPQPSSLA